MPIPYRQGFRRSVPNSLLIAYKQVVKELQKFHLRGVGVAYLYGNTTKHKTSKLTNIKLKPMRKLMTYPVGIVLKAYMAYAFILKEREKRKEQRAEKLTKKPVFQTAISK